MKFQRSKTRSIVFEPIRFFMYVLAKPINMTNVLNKIDNKSKKLSLEDSVYAVSLYGSYRTKEIMSAEYFKEFITLEFEDFSAKSIKQYDRYLSNIYGDYMQLPPLEKRVTRHGFSAYYK